jgi:hypothetical protein
MIFYWYLRRHCHGFDIYFELIGTMNQVYANGFVSIFVNMRLEKYTESSSSWRHDETRACFWVELNAVVGFYSQE